MKIGIVGLGLIGGSFAKAISEYTTNEVYGFDTNGDSYTEALETKAIVGRLDEQTIPLCDIVIISIYPCACVEFVKRHLGLFKEGSIVVDCCGIKKYVCENLFELEDIQFTYVGGHPMAGTQQWGFAHSRSTLFKGGSMILTPKDGTDIGVLATLKELFDALEFSDVVICSPDEHDRRIAFTSQLPHIISNAYVKSPRAVEHRGFSAGSYRDLSRVSKLNVPLWTELFLENAENLASEIDLLVENLQKYSKAIHKNDKEALFALLEEGHNSKKIAK